MTPALTVLARLPGFAPAVRSLSGYLPASAEFATVPRSGRCISSTAAGSAPSGASARPVRAPFRCPWTAPGVGCRWAARFASRTRATRTRHCATQPGAVAAAALAIEIHEAAAATASGTPRRHCCGVPSGLRDRRRHRLSCRHALNGSCCRWRPGGSWWRCFPQNSVKRARIRYGVTYIPGWQPDFQFPIPGVLAVFTNFKSIPVSFKKYIIFLSNFYKIREI